MATFRLHGANGEYSSCITATFGDGSQVTVGYTGDYRDEFGERRAYTFRVTLPGQSTPIEQGNDLRSGVGEGINHLKTMGAWCSFASADAERYAASMEGTPYEEWAYLHSDEISMLDEDLREGGNVFGW